MALTVKHLNADASFLLSFEAVILDAPKADSGGTPSPSPTTPAVEPFRILLDPWITGPSTILHSRISVTRHKQLPCIDSLGELPAPDLVIISQSKSDHCNEETLRQLPPSGTHTLILAEPASARLIRGWRYFDADKVITIPRWEDPRTTGRDAAVRIPVLPVVSGGEPGEVTVVFIPQRRDISGLHTAIGITYRPPPGPSSPPSARFASPFAPRPMSPLTPPASPLGTLRKPSSLSRLPTVFASSPFGCTSSSREGGVGTSFQNTSTNNLLSPPPGAPISPGPSLWPARSISSLPLAASSSGGGGSDKRKTTRAPMTIATNAPPTTTLPPLSALSLPSPSQSPSPTSPGIPPSLALRRTCTQAAHERSLSVVFAPHGIAYGSLSGWATSHLVSEAALPLTALLHCFDAVDNPWWLGGNVLLGAPAGAETAAALGAHCWVSAHDGDKDVRGWATGRLRTRRYARDEVERAVATSPRKRRAPEPVAATAPGGDSGTGFESGSDATGDKRATDSGSSSGCPAAVRDQVGGGGGSTGRKKSKAPKTEVRMLAAGEEVVLTSEGVLDLGAAVEPLEDERRDSVLAAVTGAADDAAAAAESEAASRPGSRGSAMSMQPSSAAVAADAAVVPSSPAVGAGATHLSIEAKAVELVRGAPAVVVE